MSYLILTRREGDNISIRAERHNIHAKPAASIANNIFIVSLISNTFTRM